MNSKIKNSLVSLIALFLIAIGFQNMSWLDVPAPEAKYFPKNISATTMDGVGKQIVQHNLAPISDALKERLEVWNQNRYFNLSGSEDGDLAAEFANEGGPQKKHSGWRLGMTSAANYRVAYTGKVDLACDISSNDHSYRVSMKRNISSTSDLRLVHDSKQGDSSLKMQISW